VAEDELLTDDEILDRHHRDVEGMQRTEDILRLVREGRAPQKGIAGEELRAFLEERL
jgi:hypothetical protein